VRSIVLLEHERRNEPQSSALQLITTKILKTFLILFGITSINGMYKTNRSIHLAVPTLINVVRTSVTLLACGSPVAYFFVLTSF